MSSLKLFFYFLKALHHKFFQLWSDDTSSGDKTKQIIRSLALIIGLIATFPFTPQWSPFSPSPPKSDRLLQGTRLLKSHPPQKVIA
jgi:hypothetical protein